MEEGLGERMAGSPFRLRHRRLMDTASAPASTPGHSGSNNGMTIMVTILVVVIVCSLCYCVYCWRWRKRNAVRRAQIERLRPLSNSDLPLMDLSSIYAATNSFCKENKLGEGGFGPVYRGVLGGGAEIAVKRLSARSRQGAAEFRNEVELIAKLQHRNLVRLLGCCVEKEEKMLVYEYLPNRSLDAFLFDTRKSCQLDWKMRQSIILGIARGMLYLHEDSCLKIIHRDLKASNVLLDNKMNPKISDFGMAKIFEEEHEVNTGRVVGTYGYMAPEYAMEGVFSVKSDVFSFGVLVLEILSGQRNGAMYLQEHQQTLIQDAWKLWNEDKAAEFMDASLAGSYSREEAWRCFHVGLLCVQENPELRPTMSNVVLMLISGDQTQMPVPAAPPLFTRLKTPVSVSEFSLAMRTDTTKTQSVNEVSISMIEPR
ncbi:hypothetical protein EJB05_19710 [Eragrostis curvula]|uniref:non-specific serine/threonine protein kinase n=1 Tax=Eragrostis curvula TaxID=38414 RepID=A0A5J9UY40_9POAL|nr:hypothetical protein EJB05_19710 [Eragrostis curvula]